MLEWQACETQDEVIDELCEGMRILTRNNRLTWISSLIYEDGFTFDEIRERIEAVDGDVYNITPTDKNYPDY